MTEPMGDPIGEGISRATGMLGELAMAAMMAAQAYIRMQQQRAEQQAAQEEAQRRAIEQQRRADHQAAKVAWSPAHDQKWLAGADTLNVARVWGSAVPWSEHDADAAKAMRRCEERLTDLHPEAMARYQHLRGQGHRPEDAMMHVIPQMAPQEPNPWEAGPVPAEKLDAGLQREANAWEAGRPIAGRLPAASVDLDPPLVDGQLAAADGTPLAMTTSVYGAAPTDDLVAAALAGAEMTQAAQLESTPDNPNTASIDEQTIAENTAAPIEQQAAVHAAAVHVPRTAPTVVAAAYPAAAKPQSPAATMAGPGRSASPAPSRRIGPVRWTQGHVT